MFYFTSFFFHTFSLYFLSFLFFLNFFWKPNIVKVFIVEVFFFKMVLRESLIQILIYPKNIISSFPTHLVIFHIFNNIS